MFQSHIKRSSQSNSKSNNVTEDNLKELVKMSKTFHIRSGLKPTEIKDINKYYREPYTKKEPIKSILCKYIKDAEKNSDSYSNYTKNGNEKEVLAEDRRHVGEMLPFEGTTEEVVKGKGDFGFFTAIYECYNNHWALRTIPDDWWYTIIRTVAIAIDKNSKQEKVRKFFVSHEGKKRLTVDVGPSFCNVDYIMFFRQMTNLIQSNIKVENYVNTIRSNFSTSTETHQIVSEITVMSSMQEFFEYCMRTCCGIPFVEMEGTEEDWMMMKSKLDDLKKMLEPIHDSIGLPEAWWIKVELICDRLVETYRGDGDKKWWSEIFSHQQHGFGSGAYVTYDGWFLRDLLNISKSVKSFASIPSGLVSVPLIFNNNGAETKGAIVSGIAGIKIDERGTVPVVSSTHGWAIFK